VFKRVNGETCPTHETYVNTKIRSKPNTRVRIHESCVSNAVLMSGTDFVFVSRSSSRSTIPLVPRVSCRQHVDNNVDRTVCARGARSVVVAYLLCREIRSNVASNSVCATRKHVVVDVNVHLPTTYVRQRTTTFGRRFSLEILLIKIRRSISSSGVIISTWNAWTNVRFDRRPADQATERRPSKPVMVHGFGNVTILFRRLLTRLANGSDV